MHTHTRTKHTEVQANEMQRACVEKKRQKKIRLLFE